MRFLSLLLAGLLPLGLKAQTGSLSVADKQYDLHAYGSALTGYEQALAAHPDDPSILIRIARCAYWLNQPERSWQTFRVIGDGSGFEPQDIRCMASAAMMTGRYREAEDLWSSLGDAAPAQASSGLHSSRFAASDEPLKGIAEVKREWMSTARSEFGPSWYVDRLVFSVCNPELPSPPPGWVSGEQVHYLMASGIDGNGFLYPPRLVKAMSAPVPNEGPVAFSRDGQEVVFMHGPISGQTRWVPEAGFTSALFMADVSTKGMWENIRPFPFNGTAYSTAWPAFSSDGRQLFFASDQPGGMGGFDLYVSERTETGWGTPRNLGERINTAGNEITPFPTANDLYLASDGHPGLGGYDLFRVTGKEGSPLNLGREINSPGDDLGLILVPGPPGGYLVSNRSGNGDMDLYRVRFTLIRQQLEIRDAGTGQPVPDAIVSEGSCGPSSWRSGNDGRVEISRRQPLVCPLVIQHPQYAVREVDASVSAHPEETMSIDLVPNGRNFPIRILDANSGAILSGVQARVTEQKSGQFRDVFSDHEGWVRLALSPEETYFLNFSSPGFRHEAFTLPAGSPEGSILPGTISMHPLEDLTTMPRDVPMAGPEAPPIRATETDRTSFSIQVAAVGRAADAGVEPYTRLAEFGTVYQKVSEDKIRIRVGVFTGRPEAEVALKQIRALGYPEAFVVEESVESLLDRVMLSMAKGKDAAGSGEPEYLVRLAALRKPEWFDPGKLGAFGAIRQEKVGDMTVVFIGGIPSIDRAREALKTAKASGYPDAYILYGRNGSRIKVD